ncbi:MAG: sigma-54 dependent transcriptional regulator [Polyangiaceae bacterium]
MIELEFNRFPVLVIDDEQDNLDAFRFVFRKSFSLTYAQGGEQALSMLGSLDPAVIVSDQRMPGMSGIEVLRKAQKLRPDASGVLLTAYTDLPVLLEAINSGAVYRYVQKPWDSKELTVVLRQSIERFHALRENRRLREELGRYAGYLESEQQDPMDFGELAAESPAMRAAVAKMEQLATGDGAVLISGEAGTEKELFARALHVSSAREGKPFVLVPCPSFAGGAGLEHALFGWEKGALGESISPRPGRLEIAHGGTLVLADLGSAAAPATARLAGALDRGMIERPGGELVPSDARLVVTTSEDPAAFLRHSPLAARLSGPSITVPKLSDRLSDLPAMAGRFLLRSAEKHGRPARSFSADAIAALLAYPWPGNVAELANVVERAALIADRAVVGAAFLDWRSPQKDAAAASVVSTEPIDLPGQLDDLERRKLLAALDQCAGNKAEVARLLGIQRTTLYYRLKRLGIEA